MRVNALTPWTSPGGAPSGPFTIAAPRKWAGICMPAARAGKGSSASTPATTAPARSAANRPPPNGWRANSANASARPTSWSPSPCRRSCARCSFILRPKRSIESFSLRRHRPCPTRWPTRAGSARKPPVSPWCSTLGTSACISIRTSMASCPGRASTSPAGSSRSKTPIFSCRSRSCAGSSARARSRRLAQGLGRPPPARRLGRKRHQVSRALRLPHRHRRLAPRVDHRHPCHLPLEGPRES